MSDQSRPATRPSNSAQVPPPADAPPPSPRRKPRWGRRILMVVLLLIVLVVGLVGLAPTIASTGWGRSRIVPLINEQIKGDVALGGLNLSWLSDSSLRDVSLRDAEGRDCLKVDAVQVPGGLLRLVRDFYNVGKVTVTAPEVVLFVDDAGNLSLVEALEPKQPSPAKESSPLRLPEAEVVLTGGTVRVVRPGEAEYVVPKLDVHVKTTPAGAATADFDVRLADGSALQGDVDVQDLIADGKLQLDQARGKARIATQGELDLKPLGDALLGPGQLAGKVTLDAKGEFAAGAVTADVQGGVVGLQSGQVSADSVRPIDVQLVGKVRTDAKQVGGQVQIKSTAGTISSQFDYALAAESAAGSANDEIAATVLAGRAPRLPEAKLTAQGRLDLVALADAVPALLQIRPGTRLTGGVFEIKQVNATGGDAPTATADIAITGLAAVADGKNVQVDPITAQLDIGADADRTLQIRAAAVQAGFGKLTASGTPAALAGTFDVDLARVEEQIGQIVALPVRELVGTLQVRLETKRATPERVELAFDATGANVGFRSGESQVAIAKLQAGHSGAATLVDGKLARYDATRAEVDLDGRAKATITGSYDAAEGGISGEANVAQVDLAYLAQQLEGFGVTALRGYAGQLRGQARVTRAADSEAVTAEVDAGVTGLQAAQDGAESIRPIDVQLVGKLRSDAKQVGGQVQVQSTAGEVAGQFEYALAAAAGSDAAGEDIAGTILAGRAPRLPEATLTAQGRLDLVMLADAIPALLQIRPGTRLTGGVFEIKQVKATGGDAPTATADVALTGLAAVADGRSVQVDPITAQLDVGTDADRTLQVRKAAVQAGFGKVTASGTPAALAGAFDVDLARVEQQLGQIVTLPVSELAGTLSGRIETKRANPERIELALDASGANVGFRSGANRVAIGRLQAGHEGTATLADGALSRYEAARAEVDLDGRAKAYFTGRYDAAQGGFAGEANVAQADLAYLAQQLAGFGVTALAGYAGQLQMQARVSRTDESRPIATQGSLRVQDVQLDGQPLTPSVEASWQDVAYSPAEGLLRIPAAELKSAVASVSARQFEGRFGSDVQLAGDVDASADLARTMAIVGRVAKLAEPPALAGQLTLKTKCRTDGGLSGVTGSGRIENFRAGTDERVRPETVSFDVDAAVNTKAQSIEIRKVALDSSALAAQLAGKLQEYSGASRVDVNGTYTLRWDRAMDLLLAFVPSTKGLLAVKGEHRGALRMAGPLTQPGPGPAWRGLEGGLDLSWTAAEVYGIPLSPAKLAPGLKAAQVQLPTATIQAAGGSVNIGGAVDLSGPEPILRLPPELAVLAGVKVTPQLAEHVLSRFNPIFGKLARVEGQAGLVARQVEMPLGDSLTKGGQGTGRLDLTNFKVEPSAGLLKLLVELGGLGTAEMYAIEVSGMDFVIQEGRIRYEDLTLRFAQNAFDLVFRGSVGFDDTLDLVVSVPVREQLLQRLKVGGSVLQYTKALEGLRVEIPIVGTRENPQLDLAKVDVKGLLERGLKGTVEQTGKDILSGEGLGGLLDTLGGRSGEAKGDPKAEPGAKTEPSPAPASSPRPRVRAKKSDEPSPSPSPRAKTPARRRAKASPKP